LSLIDTTAWTRETSARRGGLIAWGVVLIIIGSIVGVFIVVGLLGWLGAVEESLVQPPRGGGGNGRARSGPPVMTMVNIAAILLVLAAAAGTAWTGIASCLGRRWVRPVIVIAVSIVGLWGLLAFVSHWLLLPGALDALDAASGRRATPVPTPYSFILIFVLRGVVQLCALILLPYAILRFYLSERTARALNELDPKIGWLDRYPIPVLAWAALCALLALSTVFRLSRPTLPAFIVALKGGPAMIGLSIIAVLMAWGAWLCLRRERFGWILTYVLIVAGSVSNATFLWTGGDVTDIAFSAASADSLSYLRNPSVAPTWHAGVMAVIETALFVLLGLFVARYFHRANRQPAAFR
jgi:hypothetical protein